MLLDGNFRRCLLQSEIVHDDHRGLNNSWLHVAKCNLGKVNLEECWSAVSPAILGVARSL